MPVLSDFLHRRPRHLWTVLCPSLQRIPPFTSSSYCISKDFANKVGKKRWEETSSLCTSSQWKSLKFLTIKHEVSCRFVFVFLIVFIKIVPPLLLLYWSSFYHEWMLNLVKKIFLRLLIWSSYLKKFNLLIWITLIKFLFILFIEFTEVTLVNKTV